MASSELNSVLSRMQRELNSLEDGRISIDTATLNMGVILATLPSDVTRKSVFEGLDGARGYDQVKSNLSKSATVATVFVLGLSKEVSECVSILRDPSGKGVAKGWRRLYDAYTSKVKPGVWTAEEAFAQVAAGWQHERYSKEVETPGKRHIVVSQEVFERFEGFLDGADNETALISLMDTADVGVSAAVGAAVAEYIGVGGTEPALIHRIRAAAGKLRASAAAA
jgi:hypothetical protein